MRRPAFQIRPLATPADYAACVALQEQTWGRGFAEKVPATILRIAQKLGGVASGAFDGEGRLMGFVFGLTGWVEERPLHWSDMLAVDPAARDHGIGYRLKLHQRELLLARGVDRIQWTFDPLESRNGYLNLSRLGGVAREYHRDYYAGSDSPVHAGIGTDRLVLTWEIAGDRVVRRLAGVDRAPTTEAATALPLLNPVVEADPVRCAPPVAPEGDAVRIAVPADVQRLRERSPDVATEWRMHTRAAFEASMVAGYEVRELVRADGVGWYILQRAVNSPASASPSTGRAPRPPRR